MSSPSTAAILADVILTIHVLWVLVVILAVMGTYLTVLGKRGVL